MPSDWLWLIALGATLVAVQSMPTADEAKRMDQPKAKRSEEMLILGSQRDQTGRRAGEIRDGASSLSPSAEKRTLSDSGLEDAVEAADNQQQQQQHHHHQQQQQAASSDDGQPKALPIAGYAMDQRANEYGRVSANEIGHVRGVWDLPAYGRYYAISDEDRRKRSNESPALSSAAAAEPGSTASPAAQAQAQHQSALRSGAAASMIAQPKRSSLASYYQDPRYKRESDFEPEDFLALLSLYDNERRNRRNWRNYDGDDYDSADDESNLIGLDDEDPRSASWLDQQLAYPQQQQQHHYLSSDPVLASELAALSRSRPNNYYEQYLGQQYGNLGANEQQYDSGVQYGVAQYGVPYVQRAYYPAEKRFMVSRKRSQNYDSYGGRSGPMMSSRGYPTYQHRLLY
ncbi:prohormone-2-like isoform X3 [Phymastichus coffea]|uniref:prohormone-2-like isoform X3 n=1 Tax=Phymastichus coffea TaxID=108790 RepID=UPI00273C7AAC|nr:prohormone-2-like isoform X3 [Phymastichus coffea]